MIKNLTFFSLLFTLLILSYSAPNEDLVKNMPDDYPYKGVLYSGFLDIEGGQYIHYVFAESQSDPSKDPLVVWLNGGPGCSSLIGFIQEHGPATLRDGAGKLTINPYSWNKNANMIYIESPPGVGFSYSNSGKYSSDDSKTGLANLHAIVRFIEKFPEYKGREFFITGESYAGVYIPFLAHYILEWNKYAFDDLKINLKGFMIGNGSTNSQLDIRTSELKYSYLHNLISNENHQLLKKICKNNRKTPQCEEIYSEVKATINNLNPYHIYKKCGKEPTTLSRNSKVDFKRTYRYQISSYFGIPSGLEPGPGYNCSVDDNVIYDFFNQEAVQKALNIKNYVYWQECWDGDYNGNPADSLALYPNLLKSGLKIHHFNGDADSVVPFNDLFNWVDTLKLKVKKNWRPWRVLEDRNGGFIIDYDGLTVITIQGDGHMVAEWKPREAQYIFNAFIHNQELE